MAGIKDYVKYDALGLAGLVKKKKVSPAELVEEAVSRIEAGNPKINAVIHKMYDIGRKTAKGQTPRRPLYRGAVSPEGPAGRLCGGPDDLRLPRLPQLRAHARQRDGRAL